MTQRMPFAPLSWSVLTALFLATGTVMAAPASSEELNAAATPPSGGPIVPATPLVVGLGVSQSKTVELLLQLQDQPPESKSTADSPRRPAPAPTKATTGTTAVVEEVNPLLALKTTLLGTATPRESNQDAQRAESASQTSHDPMPMQRSGSTASTVPDGEPRQSLLSHPVVRFLREHRGLILTVSLGILAALWFTASFSMRRSR